MIKAKNPVPWKPEDLEKLREMYPKLSVSTNDLKSAFPNFSMKEIQYKASRLGVKRTSTGSVEVVWCRKCNLRYEPTSEMVYCTRCGKKVRMKFNSPGARQRRTKDLPESTAIPLEERNQL